MKLVKILVYVFAAIGVFYVAFLAFAYNSSCISYPIKSAVSKNQQRKAELKVNSCKNSMESSIYLAIYNKSDAKYHTQIEIAKTIMGDRPRFYDWIIAFSATINGECSDLFLT